MSVKSVLVVYEVAHVAMVTEAQKLQRCGHLVGATNVNFLGLMPISLCFITFLV